MDCYNVCRKGKEFLVLVWLFFVLCFGGFFLFCQSEAVKALHIPVTSVHSVLLLTLACYRGMLFAFWTLRFSRAGKIEMPC